MEIRRVSPEQTKLVDQHLERHLAESGTYGIHWLPYDPATLPAPPRAGQKAILLSPTEPGWQRWFGLFNGDDDIVGHLSLKGSRLNRTLHRCELGMGLERPFIQRGYGAQLLDIAIREARQVPSIDWLDLRVLSCNAPVYDMYVRKGFTETCRIDDFCRIDEQPVADIMMSLSVATNECDE